MVIEVILSMYGVTLTSVGISFLAFAFSDMLIYCSILVNFFFFQQGSDSEIPIFKSQFRLDKRGSLTSGCNFNANVGCEQLFK